MASAERGKRPVWISDGTGKPVMVDGTYVQQRVGGAGEWVSGSFYSTLVKGSDSQGELKWGQVSGRGLASTSECCSGSSWASVSPLGSSVKTQTPLA